MSARPLEERLAEAKRMRKLSEGEAMNHKIQPWQSQAEFLQEKEILRSRRNSWARRVRELEAALADRQ